MLSKDMITSSYGVTVIFCIVGFGEPDVAREYSVTLFYFTSNLQKE